MAQFSDFYRFIRPIAPSAPEPALDTALLESAIDFCRESRVLQKTLHIQTIIGKARYRFDLDGCHTLFEIRKVEALHGEHPRTLCAMREADAMNLITGKPTGFWLPARDTINFYPIPNQSEEMRVLGALCPNTQAAELDDRLLDEWREAVVAGAVVRLSLAIGADKVTPGPWVEIVQNWILKARALAFQSHGQARLKTKLWT